MKIMTEGLFLNTDLVTFNQRGTPTSSLFQAPVDHPPQPVKLKHPFLPCIVPWTNNLCASLFVCQRLNICAAFSWVGVFLWGRMAGTGWMLDNKPAASLLSVLAAGFPSSCAQQFQWLLITSV